MTNLQVSLLQHAAAFYIGGVLLDTPLLVVAVSCVIATEIGIACGIVK